MILKRKDLVTLKKQNSDYGKVMKRLLSYIFKKHKLRFAIVLVTILLSAVATVASSLFIQVLIDQYITPLIGDNHPNLSGLMNALFFMAIIYLGGVFSTLCYSIVMVFISQSIQKEIRDEMFTAMQKLPIKYFDTHSSGDIMSHYTNDIDTLRQMLSQSVPQLFSSVVTVVAVFIAMLVTNFLLTLVVVVCAVATIIVVKTIASKSSVHFVRQQKSLGKVNGYIEEIMNGQKVVKVFNHETEAKETAKILNEELFENGSSANKFSNILMPIMVNISNLQYVLIAIIGGYMAIAGVGNLTIGIIATFLQLSKAFSQPINQISQQLSFVIMAMAGAERIFDLIDETPEEDDGYVTLVSVTKENDQFIESESRTELWAWRHPHSDGTVTYTELKGNIVFENVNFGYNPDKIVLHDISLYAHSGQKVAFVGATGAGKTTITNLINRFYDIQSGKIRYDGINITKIKKAALRRSLGIVLQDTSLFTGTIMENIRYGKLNATDEEVIAAAKLANADSFIEQLPQGYNTMVSGSGDGTSLSQGQQQLLTIARAALANHPVMILDEATSNIDTRTEKIVQGGMDKLMEGRTVFVIAHRLSTIQNSDVIMVLDHGKIVERGDHDKLIQNKQIYYQLYTGALELD